MSDTAIPFHRPTLGGKELEYLTEAVTSRKIVGDGPFSKRCAELLQKELGSLKVLMTPSCTAALEMAALLCPIEPGDEVIMPSYTFVSTANAVVLRGGIPVFVDIRPDTLNIDERQIEAAITPKTKAISVVHYAGVSCEMDTILSIAARFRIKIVEDAAQGVHASYRGRALGSMGNFGCFSFHETKNFVAGEGGAISINQHSDLENAEVVREKGTNRSKFLRGQVDKYTWVAVGSSFLPSDLACAFLLAQLEKMHVMTEERQRVYRSYYEGLKPLQDGGFLTLPVVPSHCQSNYHIFHLLLPTGAAAQSLLKFLRDDGIAATSHYVPLHTSPFGRRYHSERTPLPVTDLVSECIVRLPLFAELNQGQTAKVIDRITRFCRKMG